MSDSIHSQRHYQQTLSTNLWNNQSCLRGRDFAKTKCLFGWKCDRRVIGEIVSCEVIKTNVHKLDKRIIKPKDASNHHPCDSWTSSAALLWPGLCCHYRRNTPRITLLLHIWGFYWRYVRKEATVHQCHQFLFVLVAFIWQPEERQGTWRETKVRMHLKGPVCRVLLCRLLLTMVSGVVLVRWDYLKLVPIL